MFRFLASILTVVFLILILTGIFGIGLIRPLFRKKDNGKGNSFNTQNTYHSNKSRNKSRKIISDDVGEYVNFEEVEKNEKKEDDSNSEITE